MKKIRVAVIGQGRSGKDIHGRYFLSAANTKYDVKYVVEADPHRREISKSRYPSCEVCADYRELWGREDVDLVVNASFSHMHYAITKDLMEHGYHVLTEKPFTRNRFESDTLIQLAKEKDVVLAVFQQTFYAPFYQDARHVMQTQKIGEVKQINIRYNGFSRRWDWQTLQKRMGGDTYNTGPHPLGMALGFLDFDEHTHIAFSRREHTPMSSGDSDDYCKVILEAPHKPVLDVEISHIDAYADYSIKMQGTRGTFKNTPAQYSCTYLVEGENPVRPVVDGILQDENGNPIYCRENLVKHQESGTYAGNAFDVGTEKFYEDLYGAITERREMEVTPSMAGRIISLIEELHASHPLPLRYGE